MPTGLLRPQIMVAAVRIRINGNAKIYHDFRPATFVFPN